MTGTAAQPPGVDTVLTGWGGSTASRARVLRPGREHVPDLLRSPTSRGVLARGLGRAYGDSACNAGGLVLDTTGLDRVLEVDVVAGTARVEAGVSIGALIAATAGTGWFVPVTPGTRFVTVGGAVAADVHGKNHHHDGSFGSAVAALTLALPGGDVRVVTPGATPELFRATVGGMGLTGVVLDATVCLVPAASPDVLVDTWRCDDLDDVLAALDTADRSQYSVAWVDMTARGRRSGRGVVTAGDHALPTPDPVRGKSRESPLATLPAFMPDVLSPALVRAFNAAYQRRAPRHRSGERQSVATFFHPLDAVGRWHRAYGPRGLVQYQVVVPDVATLRRVMTTLEGAGPSYLAVLKRFGAGGVGMLSFPRPGWTLALDYPAGLSGLAEVFDACDRIVADTGGAVYLAKDARMDSGMMHAMYPELDAWRAVRDDVAPRQALMSDQARRLRL